MSKENFWGTLIRTLREEQGVSQRTLAVKTKVSRSTLRKIEAGETSGDIQVIETLIGYMGYELEAINVGRDKAQRDSATSVFSDRRSRLAAARVLTIPL